MQRARGSPCSTVGWAVVALVALVATVGGAAACDQVFGIHEIAASGGDAAAAESGPTPSPDAGLDAGPDARPSACEAGAPACAGQQPVLCNPTGTGGTPVGPSCSASHQACAGGACVGSCIPGTQMCAGNQARTCDSSGSWGAATACASGQVCDAADGGTGACAAGCWIQSTFQQPGARDPNDPCQGCQPDASTASWSPLADGTTCASESGNVCCSAKCSLTDNDVDNCGGCGRACVDGPSPTCTSGSCNYELTNAFALRLALDGAKSGIFFTSGDGHVVPGAIQNEPLAGGIPVTLAANLPSPYALAVSGSNLYWTDNVAGAVMEIPVGGGASTTVASGQATPYEIVTDATNVYWVDTGTAANTYTDAAIVKAPLAGGPPVTIVSSAQLPNGGIAIDATNVYWTAAGCACVLRAPLGGGSTTTLVSGLPNGPQDVAVDGTSVYWTSNGPTIGKVALGGGAPQTLYPGGSLTFAIALDATNVYWTDTTDGTVMTMPVGGGAATTLASGQTYPMGLVVSPADVFWSNAGVVMSAPK